LAKKGPVVKIEEWFGFNSPTYDVDQKEPKILAFNEDFANYLIRSSERGMVSGIAPKFVLMEMSGDGKTHAMNYAMNVLRERELIDKVYFVCPSLASGTSYTELHGEIVLHMHKQKLILPLFEKIYNDCSSSEPHERLEEISERLGFDDLAHAIVVNQTGEVGDTDFLHYLMGKKIDKTLQKDLDVLSSLNVETAVDLIKIIAEFHYKFFNKMIVVIIDEVDEMKAVRQSIRQFKEAFRRMAEIRLLGLVFIYNVATHEEMRYDTLPTPLKDPGVMSRIGSENYMFKPIPMKYDKVKPLLLEINESMRGEKFEEAFRQAKKENSKLDKDHYPFSKDGFDEVIKKVHEFSITRKGEYLLPRDVITYARKCIGEAYLDKKRCVDKSVVKLQEYTQTYIPKPDRM